MDNMGNHRGAEFLIGENEKEVRILKLMAAIDIVQEAARRQRRKPNERYDGRFFWPGNAIAWAVQVWFIYKDLPERIVRND